MIDVEDLASGVCDCQVVVVSQLSEARALQVLSDDFGLDVTGASAVSDAPLAGALCIANAGALRWILVRKEDSDERRRFSIAHELGHLFIEVEPELERMAVRPVANLLPQSEAEIRIFNRCSTTHPTFAMHDVVPTSKAFSKADLREIRAHHFAAELLMPYEGVRRLIGHAGGVRGIRTTFDLNQLVNTVAARYVVSGAAARLRIEKDFGTAPIGGHANVDLFE